MATTFEAASASSPPAIPFPPHSAPVTIVVCDSTPASGHRLARALRCQPGVEVVGVTTTGEQAERLVRELLPDVVLVDLRGPGIDSSGITRRVRFASPTTKVAMLTRRDTDPDLYEALASGASGGVNRRNAMAEIATAVRSVGSGKLVIPAHLAPDVLHDLEADGASSLTATERAFLASAARGETGGELGDTLHLTEHAVHRLVEGIYAKWHLAHRSDTARTAPAVARVPAVLGRGR